MGLYVFEGATGSGSAVLYVLIGLLLFVLPRIFALPKQALTAGILVLLFMVASLQGVLTVIPPLGRASVALRNIEERMRSLEPEGPE